MPGLDWTDPWVIGTIAAVAGVLALVGVTFSYLPQRRVRAAALAAGFLGIAGLAAATGLSIRGLTALRHPPAKPQPAALPSAQEMLERFRQAAPADRLAMVQRLPEGERGWYTVGRGDVTPIVVERGTVEPTVATDLKCGVRTHGPGAVAAVIKSVVEDGTPVKKGQLLMQLDDAPLRDELGQRKAAVEQKRAALADAEKVGTGAGAAPVAAARAALDAEAQRVKELKADVAHCKLVAPHDGFVIYYVPEQARFGSGAGVSVVAVGEPVRQGQKLLRVCDLTKFQVRTRVHEALVSRVRVGQEARVRIDAFPGRRLSGRVKDVARVASQQDFFASDVKVYPTTVALEGDVPGLKPGMSGEVTIVTGQHKGVLRLPAQAVLRAGRVKWVCYVRTGAGVEERGVELGASDDAFVEIREGLKEGDEVLRDPRSLAIRLAESPGAQARGSAARDVVVQSVRLPPEGEARRARTVAYGLTSWDLERLAALPGVTRVVPVRSFPQELRYLERRHAGRVIATTPQYAESEGLELGAGRFFTAAEDEQLANVAVLGAAAAERLFPDEAPVGRSVRVGSRLFQVVGVLRESGPEAAPDAKAGGDVYLPLGTCQARFGKTVVIRRRGSVQREQVELTQVTLTLARADQVDPTVEAARALLRASHPKKDWDVLPGLAD